MNLDQKILKKIKNSPFNTYVIFYTADCNYCQRALDLLRAKKLSYKGYDIDNIRGGLSFLLELFNKNRSKIKFNPYHRTKPLIFINSSFLGGYDDLISSLTNK